MPPGVKWRRRTLARHSAALSAAVVLGYGGSALAQTPHSQATPAQATLAQTTPAQTTPAQTTPAQTTPAQTTKPPTTKPGPKEEKKPTPAKVEKVEKTRAESLLGQPVLDVKRQTIGHIVDVLIDTDGHPQAAVIEFTGFLGVGDRKVAVTWKALHFALEGDRIVISVGLDVAALRAMPEYSASAKSVPVAAPAHSASGSAQGQ